LPSLPDCITRAWQMRQDKLVYWHCILYSLHGTPISSSEHHSNRSPHDQKEQQRRHSQHGPRSVRHNRNFEAWPASATKASIILWSHLTREHHALSFRFFSVLAAGRGREKIQQSKDTGAGVVLYLLPQGLVWLKLWSGAGQPDCLKWTRANPHCFQSLLPHFPLKHNNHQHSDAMHSVICRSRYTPLTNSASSIFRFPASGVLSHNIPPSDGFISASTAFVSWSISHRPAHHFLAILVFSAFRGTTSISGERPTQQIKKSTKKVSLNFISLVPA